MPRASLGAVEAIEHVRQVALGEARAVVAHRRATPSRSATSTSPPGGLHLRALSSRFETARRCARARRARPSARAWLRSAARRRAARARSDERGDELVEAHVVEPRSARAPRASSTTSPTSAVSSSSSAMMSARRLSRSSLGQPIGVLEHLDVRAQARRSACAARGSHRPRGGAARSTERSSASSVALKLRASRASSSRPLDLEALREVGVARRAPRSRRVKRATGASAVRATSAPSSAASTMPTHADEREQHQQQRLSSSSTSVSGRATWTAPRRRRVPTVSTRRCTPLTVRVAEVAPAAARGDRRSRASTRSQAGALAAGTTIAPLRETNCTYPEARRTRRLDVAREPAVSAAARAGAPPGVAGERGAPRGLPVAAVPARSRSAAAHEPLRALR